MPRKVVQLTTTPRTLLDISRDAYTSLLELVAQNPVDATIWDAMTDARERYFAAIQTADADDKNDDEKDVTK